LRNNVVIMKVIIIGTMIGARFPNAIVRQIDIMVESDEEYMSRADVIRDLVRDALKRRNGGSVCKPTEQPAGSIMKCQMGNGQ